MYAQSTNSLVPQYCRIAACRW